MSAKAVHPTLPWILHDLRIVGRVKMLRAAVGLALAILAACQQGAPHDSPPRDRDITSTEPEFGGSPADNQPGFQEVFPARTSDLTGTVIPISSESHATYRLLRWSRRANGNLEVITRGDSEAGTIFERRELDCDGANFRFLAQGDTLMEAEQQGISEPMGALSVDAPSEAIAQYVCNKN